MYTYINYIVAFWSMVVVPCATNPSNWEHCYKIDEWLIPDLIHAWELKTKERHIYQEEKEYLDSITQENTR